MRNIDGNDRLAYRNKNETGDDLERKSTQCNINCKRTFPENHNFLKAGTSVNNRTLNIKDVNLNSEISH